MNLSLKGTEQMIKDYYRREKLLVHINSQIEILKEQEKKLQDKINNSEIFLQDNSKAVNYKEQGSRNGVKTSPQEQAVDKAFLTLEKNLEQAKEDIALFEVKICCIEVENKLWSFILKNMKSDYRAILEGLYRDNNNYIQLSVKLNMDKATIYRRRDKAIEDIKRWLEYYSKL